MTPLVSVLTATIPGRENLLKENRRSIKAQTLAPSRFEHLVHLDEGREGCSVSYNLLADQARGEWLFILADDDLALPGCLQAHLACATGADIVYSPPLVWGEPPDQFHSTPPCIPATCLIRTELWRRLGGYDVRQSEQEDRVLFTRALELGAFFVRADTSPTWLYRFHGGNKSRHNGLAS